MSALRNLSGLDLQSPCKSGYQGAERTRTAVTVVQSENEQKSPRTLDGWPTFLTATALTASLIPWPSMWQVMGLLALLVLTPAVGKR